MMTMQEAIEAMELGYKVQAGQGQDHDTGYIHHVDDRFARVAWDSGVVTPCPLADLQPA